MNLIKKLWGRFFCKGVTPHDFEIVWCPNHSYFEKIESVRKTKNKIIYFETQKEKQIKMEVDSYNYEKVCLSCGYINDKKKSKLDSKVQKYVDFVNRKRDRKRIAEELSKCRRKG